MYPVHEHTRTRGQRSVPRPSKKKKATVSIGFELHKKKDATCENRFVVKIQINHVWWSVFTHIRTHLRARCSKSAVIIFSDICFRLLLTLSTVLNQAVFFVLMWVLLLSPKSEELAMCLAKRKPRENVMYENCSFKILERKLLLNNPLYFFFRIDTELCDPLS